jgi:hypothetical protein
LAGEPSAARVNGTLVEIDGVPVLRIWGTPQERGYAQGYLLADRIVPLLDAFIGGGTLGGSPANYEQFVLPMVKRMEIQPEYLEELRAVQAGVEARMGGPARLPLLGRALRLEDLIAVNCTADITRMGCSSFAAWGPMTKDTGTIAGRNMDWPAVPAMLGALIIVVNVPSADSGGLAWVSVTYPGYLVCQTGMNAEGVTVSMHDAGGFPPEVKAGFTPRGFALREAIESARGSTAFDDVTRVLRDRICAIGNNVPVNRPYTGEGPGGAVFEYDGGLAYGKGVTVREASDDAAYVICTNHYRKRAEPVPCSRYARLASELERIADSRGGRHLTTKLARKMLGKVSMEGILTHHSVVFEPNRRVMHVAFATASNENAPACEFVTLDVAELLDGRGPFSPRD